MPVGLVADLVTRKHHGRNQQDGELDRIYKINRILSEEAGWSRDVWFLLCRGFAVGIVRDRS
jgi:hypothetical protein